MGPSMWTQPSRLPQSAPERHTSSQEQPWACSQPQPGTRSRRLLLRCEGPGGGRAAPEVNWGRVEREPCSLHAQHWMIWLGTDGAGAGTPCVGQAGLSSMCLYCQPPAVHSIAELTGAADEALLLFCRRKRPTQLIRLAAGGRAEGTSGRGRGRGGRGPTGRGKKRARSDTPDPRSRSEDGGQSVKPSSAEVLAGSPDSKKPALGGSSAASPSPRAARSRSRAAAAQAAEAATGAGPSADPEVGSGAHHSLPAGCPLQEQACYSSGSCSGSWPQSVSRIPRCAACDEPIAMSHLHFRLVQSICKCLS